MKQLSLGTYFLVKPKFNLHFQVVTDSVFQIHTFVTYPNLSKCYPTLILALYGSLTLSRQAFLP